MLPGTDHTTPATGPCHLQKCAPPPAWGPAELGGRPACSAAWHPPCRRGAGTPCAAQLDQSCAGDTVLRTCRFPSTQVLARPGLHRSWPALRPESQELSQPWGTLTHLRAWLPMRSCWSKNSSLAAPRLRPVRRPSGPRLPSSSSGSFTLEPAPPAMFLHEHSCVSGVRGTNPRRGRVGRAGPPACQRSGRATSRIWHAVCREGVLHQHTPADAARLTFMRTARPARCQNRRDSVHAGLSLGARAPADSLSADSGRTACMSSAFPDESS